MKEVIVLLLAYAWVYGMITITAPPEPTYEVTTRHCPD